MDREKRKAIWVLGVLVVLMAAGVWYFNGTEPPAAVTAARMGAVEDGVRAYHSAEGRVPVSLEELVRSGHLEGEAVDGWGKLLRYRVVSDVEVEVASLGADEKVGGRMFKKDRLVKVSVE
ncbi:MAG: hypothetical protein P8J87_19965 [Verrucomicrobiales bacterium]|nr:hypothetical protein [Verrucomicrobiales bacterium]